MLSGARLSLLNTGPGCELLHRQYGHLAVQSVAGKAVDLAFLSAGLADLARIQYQAQQHDQESAGLLP